MATSPGPCYADIVAACCWLRSQKALTENAELKRRLRLWEAGEVSEPIAKVLGQEHSRPLRRRKRVMQSQTDEQRGKRACALTARGSISKAMKGLVGGAAQGTADCRKNWTSVPDSTELGPWHPLHLRGMCRGGACCLERWPGAKQRGAP